MVFKIIKTVVKCAVLLTLGAAIGIWFAPPQAKVLMGKKLAVAQGHAQKFHKGANKLWIENLQKKLAAAGKSLDPRRIDKDTVNSWVNSGKHTIAAISADAKQTQESISKAGQVLQSARSEYQKVGAILGM